jgi:hypothetical protein
MPKARRITRRSSSGSPASSVPAIAADRLLGDIRALIEAAREQTARAVNSALVGLYWHIGKRIREDVLQEKRAEYGERIVSALSAQLTAEYGRGYDRRNLYHMIRFAEVFPDEAIVNALRTQLSWTHFRELLAIDDNLKREFYAEICRLERWSTRTLQQKIAHFLYERTAVSKKPDEMIARDFRDEVLARLLELNRQRAEEERLSGIAVAATGGGRTRKKPTGGKTAARKNADHPDLFGGVS